MNNDNGAQFSNNDTFRQLLWRRWNNDLPLITFWMLNPSKAGAFANDPTTRKCMGFAKRWGYGGVILVNLYDFIATDPKTLQRASYPVSSGNPEAWVTAIKASGAICMAWGANARPPVVAERARYVRSLVAAAGCVPCVIKLLDSDTPQHPLMAAYTNEPIAWPQS